jgi:hypothetical protein
MTDKQKKALWIAGAVLIAIHYAPTILNTVRQQHAADRFAHGGASSTPVTPPPAPVPPPTPEEVQTAQLEKLAGTVWGGTAPVPSIGFCEIRLEIKTAEGKPGFTGYSTMSCNNVLRFRPGQRSNPQNAKGDMAAMLPVSAILSGEIKGNAVELNHQEQAIGARDGCNIESARLVPFGDSNMAVTWTEGPLPSCTGGQVVMHKVRGL